MLLGIFASVVGLWLAVVVLASCSYRALLYPAPNEPQTPFASNAELRVLKAKDGTVVHALHFRASSGKPPVLVHFHGNGESIRSMSGVASDLHARGYEVVLAEYRGYGPSKEAAKPTEKGLYADAEAVLDALAGDGVAKERIVLWGTSLGTGVATEMASRGRGGALVLVAPFTSIPAVAARVVPLLLPVGLIVSDRFDNLAKAGRVKIPTLVFHGTDDEIIPWWMGKNLAASIEHATFVSLPGAHHNDVYERAEVFERLCAHAGPPP